MDCKPYHQDTITFQNELAWDETSPAHVSAFRDFLLSFGGTIADRTSFGGEFEEARTLLENELLTGLTESERNQAESAIKHCEKSSDLAKSLERDYHFGHESYDPWCPYYATTFISELEQATGARRDISMYNFPRHSVN